MIGAIRKRDILAHPLVTIDCFGWNVFFRALLAGRNVTFLSLLAESGSLHVAEPKVPELVQRCVDLEGVAQRVYETLAERFADRQPVARFFATVARQEQGHAELLQLCRAAAERDGWAEKHFAPWRNSVPGLERQMKNAEASSTTVQGVHDALRLVIQIESSELDSVFDGVMAASDSEFVRRLRAFQKAGDNHTFYICQQIAELEPDLAEECQTVRMAHAGHEEHH